MNGTILFLFAFICFLPFYYVLTISLSDLLGKEGVLSILPQGISTTAYQNIYKQVAL
jgi:ABC-type glycerol-3-phosphate transport system permease component